jgi:hypothetical protein
MIIIFTIIDKNFLRFYSEIMNATVALIKEIETMPQEFALEVLHFIMFIKNQRAFSKQPQKIATKDAYGIFRDLKGIDTTIEREEDRL